ncbi:MAG: glycosyltransferase family 4 protein [Chromatiales bacterium]|nr:glycosyltransferase family 4 protein [Chromatiales bacterium]
MAAGLAYRFTRPESRLHILDQPNHRSLHDLPVPRSGGVAVLLAILMGVAGISILWSLPFSLLGMLLGLLAVSVVGFIDDMGGVRPRYRLLVQVGAALCLVVSGLRADVLNFPGGSWVMWSGVAVVVSCLFVVWMVNLYNFMDGMDGLAGCMALIGFGTLALFGWLQGHVVFTLLNSVVAMSALGFLVLNFPPAKLFLGDVGAYGFGFLSAGMLLWGDQLGIVPLWIGLLIFSPFIADATSTLLIRLIRGKRVWEAHREHAYQHAVQSGLGHRSTLILSIGIMLSVSVSALLLREAAEGVQWLLISIWLVFYLAVFWYARKSRYNQSDMSGGLG